MEGDPLEKIIMGVGATTLAAGVIITGAAIGSITGSFVGEVLDHLPYLKHAIPEGLSYLANYINPEAAKQAKIALEGNLDKVGAAMGFIGGFYKSIVSYKKD